MSRFLRVFPVLAAVLLLGLAVQAQENSVGITGKGIKLGAGWGSLSTNNEAFESGSTAGFAAAAFLTYSFTPKLALQPEVMYVRKGAGENYIFVGDGYKLGYLEFPVLLKYKLVDGKRLIPSLFAGPAVSTLLSAEIYQDNFFSDDEVYDVKDGMKSVDFGLVFGGEVAFQSTRQVKFFLDVRYTLGLNNVIDPVKWNDGREIVDEGDWGIFHWTDYNRPLIEEDVEVKNQVFSFLIGIRF